MISQVRSSLKSIPHISSKDQPVVAGLFRLQEGSGIKENVRRVKVSLNFYHFDG